MRWNMYDTDSNIVRFLWTLYFIIIFLAFLSVIVGHSFFEWWTFGFGHFLLFVVGFGAYYLIYFIPFMIAHYRGHPDESAIFILNFFLGFTYIGWVIAFVWACIHGKSNPDKGKNININRFLKK